MVHQRTNFPQSNSTLDLIPLLLTLRERSEALEEMLPVTSKSGLRCSKPPSLMFIMIPFWVNEEVQSRVWKQEICYELFQNLVV